MPFGFDISPNLSLDFYVASDRITMMRRLCHSLVRSELYSAII